MGKAAGAKGTKEENLPPPRRSTRVDSKGK